MNLALPLCDDVSCVDDASAINHHDSVESIMCNDFNLLNMVRSAWDPGRVLGGIPLGQLGVRDTSELEIRKTEDRWASPAPHWAPLLRYITLKRPGSFNRHQHIITFHIANSNFACSLRDPIFTQH